MYVSGLAAINDPPSKSIRQVLASPSDDQSAPGRALARASTTMNPAL
jgi:hypothetical protein